MGINLFAGFPVDGLLVDGNAVRGVRTTPSGLDRRGQPTGDYTEPTDLTARVTVVAEGTRGLLSQAYREWQKIGSPNPQLFALGVKEVWQTRMPLDRVVHTLGWPLPTDAFGGSFMYPLGPDSSGHRPGSRPRLSRRRTGCARAASADEAASAFSAGTSKVASCWSGARRPFPEGGYYSLPERRYGDGILMVGDAAGFVDVPSLKGIHYAMQSGIFAARAAFSALDAGDSLGGRPGCL